MDGRGEGDGVFGAATNNESNLYRAREREQPNLPFNVVNIDFENPFQHNPNVLGQNNLMNMRDRLFHAIYFKAAVLYAQIFPSSMRNALECFILSKAIIFFMALVYIHVSFIKNPATCLQHVADWPRNGVLRVEIIPNLIEKRMMLQKYYDDQLLRHKLRKQFYYGIGPQTEGNLLNIKKLEHSLLSVGYQLNDSFVYLNEKLSDYLTKESIIEVSKSSVEKSNDYDVQEYIVEYALEYGYLRLSPITRKRLKIPIRIVQLDPATNKCFGDKFSKLLLRSLLGYDDLLLASVRVLAEKEENKGYLRNVITGEHYRFVTMWWSAWTSYITAFTIMTLFTFSISILLRFSHHQIFAFIVDLLQMLEFNGAARFPIAPLLTVILALVGMEAIMSEFFNDTTTAFYIIVIVWVADQYDAVCCHTNITKRYWLRFFYLYLYSFYAYHYRFSGQNRSLALVSSWLFIQHSMFFFFHRYELPVILQQARLIARQNELDEGTEPQQPQQQLQQRLLGGSRLLTRIFGQLQQQQPQHGVPEGVFNILPLFRALTVPGGNRPFEYIRRSLLPSRWIAPQTDFVSVQERNVQRNQIGSTQTLSTNASNFTQNVQVNPSHSIISRNDRTSSNMDLCITHNNGLRITSTDNDVRSTPANNFMHIPTDTKILETTADTNLECKIPLKLPKFPKIFATDTVENLKKRTGNKCKERQEENNEIGKEIDAEIKNSYPNMTTKVVFDETIKPTRREITSTVGNRICKTTLKRNNDNLENYYLENELLTLKKNQKPFQEDLLKSKSKIISTSVGTNTLLDNVTKLIASSDNFKSDRLNSLNTRTNQFMMSDQLMRTRNREKLQFINNNYSKTITRTKLLTNTSPISHSSNQLVDSKEKNISEYNNTFFQF